MLCFVTAEFTGDTTSQYGDMQRARLLSLLSAKMFSCAISIPLTEYHGRIVRNPDSYLGSHGFESWPENILTEVSCFNPEFGP